ncbi:MAG: CapA family protein [Thermodesulfobacteriota bacterium]|nr:CapA family protein [Thermodesulfobacteriota bacterium]
MKEIYSRRLVVRSAGRIFILGLAVFLSLAPSLAGAEGEALTRNIIKVAAVGDVMMGTENLLPPDGGAGLFTASRPYLRQGDIVFCNHEGTLTDQGRPTKKSVSGRAYCFRTPPHYVRFLDEAGFNMVSIANNHINDYGPKGKQMTMAILKKQGIAFSGPPGTVAGLTVRGIKVVMAAFHSSAHSHWLIDIPGAKRIVAGLAKDNDIVIVSFHGGKEGQGAVRTPREMEFFFGERRGEVVKFSRAVIDSGADLVIGHGPHVPRAMEVYKGRLIAYSLGNFCTGKGISVKGYAAYAPLLLAELTPDGRLAGGRVVSFFQTFGRPPILDKNNRAARLIHDLGRRDFPQSNAVTGDGNLIPPK